MYRRNRGRVLSEHSVYQGRNPPYILMPRLSPPSPTHLFNKKLLALPRVRIHLSPVLDFATHNGICATECATIQLIFHDLTNFIFK